ncbi:MAG: hypothetical protein LBL94_12255 [Prevotellaceae bacterium]|jgi:hypothetical protein|nr:hypothetical protein [Prevotellaceae bacterium]
MSFYRTSFLVAVLLILFSGKAATAQTEHHFGVIAGKVLGPIYTLQHNRWSVTAIGGWLTGVSGGHVSVTGQYRLLYHESGLMMADMGMGLFGQRYTAASGSMQERFAKRMNYDTPFGVQITAKLLFNFAEKWSYGMHIGMPLILTENEFKGEKSFWEAWLEIFQFSLQYKL